MLFTYWGTILQSDEAGKAKPEKELDRRQNTRFKVSRHVLEERQERCVDKQWRRHVLKRVFYLDHCKIQVRLAYISIEYVALFRYDKHYFKA